MILNCSCGKSFKPAELDGKETINLEEAIVGDTYGLTTDEMICPKCGVSYKVSLSLEVLEIQSANDRHFRKLLAESAEREREREGKEAEERMRGSRREEEEIFRGFFGMF